MNSEENEMIKSQTMYESREVTFYGWFFGPNAQKI